LKLLEETLEKGSAIFIDAKGKHLIDDFAQDLISKRGTPKKISRSDSKSVHPIFRISDMAYVVLYEIALLDYITRNLCCGTLRRRRCRASQTHTDP